MTFQKVQKHVVDAADAAGLLAAGQIGAIAERSKEDPDTPARRADAHGQTALLHASEFNPVDAVQVVGVVRVGLVRK